MRLEQLSLQQVATDALDPSRLDGRQAATEQARGLDQLGGNQPAAGLLRQIDAGMAPELDAARAEVPVLVVGLESDVAEQSGQQRHVDLLIVRRRAVQMPAVFGRHRQQLRVDVAPLAHAAHGDEVVAQALLLLAVGQLVLRVLGAVAAAGLEPLPELQGATEFAALIVEGLVLLVGDLGAFLRPVAHVLARQGGCNDQHFGQRLPVASLDDHAADARVERQPGQFAADGRQLIALVHRAQLAEQGVAIDDGLLRRWLEKGEFLDQAKA